MATRTEETVEKQKRFIAQQLQKPLRKGDTWYIIDAKWFKQWKSYVGYESSNQYHVGEESVNPGPIDNTLLFEEATNKLKEHLIDDLDYVLVPAEAWVKLHSWYGMVEGQQPLPRKVIEEGVYSKSLKVEVYLWHLKLCENSKPDELISKPFSRADTIEHLEKSMRKIFDIPEEKEVRLWNRYLTNMYQQLKNKNKTIQDAGLYLGQVIVIEQKNDDGTWPRQTTNKNQTVKANRKATTTKPTEPTKARYENASSYTSPASNDNDMGTYTKFVQPAPQLEEYSLNSKAPTCTCACHDGILAMKRRKLELELQLLELKLQKYKPTSST